MKDYRVADYMLLVMSMEETDEMFSTQDLSGLVAQWFRALVY